MEKDFYSMEELNSLFNALDEHQHSAPAEYPSAKADISVEKEKADQKASFPQPEEKAAPADAVLNAPEPVQETKLPEAEPFPEPELTEEGFEELRNNAPSAEREGKTALEIALQEYARGNYAQAANQLAIAAVNEEDFRAARMLGDMIDFGEANNMGTAADWYVRAMAVYQMQEMEKEEPMPGNRLNMYRLAMCYALGNGVAKKTKRALSMLEKAGLTNISANELKEILIAEKLDGEKEEHLEPDAEELLVYAELLLNSKNARMLIRDYVQAAEQKLMSGSLPEAEVLGHLYYMQGNCQMYGYGCVKNANLGRVFWQEAAHLGNKDAENALKMAQV